MSTDFLDTAFPGTMNSMDSVKASSQDDQSGRASFEAESPLYKTDEFRMYCFKVLPCSKRYCHDWTTCPFAHPGEKAKRRDPRVYQYTGIACPEMKKNLACPRGETCPYAHNVFEYWLHPSRYRTQLCNDGVNCKRKVCFFAHTLEELRVPSCKPVLPDSAIDAGRQDTDAGFPIQGYLGGSDQGFASLPAGAASPVSTLGAGNEMWDNSPASTPTSTWSPYNQAMSYPDHHPTDASAAALLSRQQSPAGGNPAALEQLAQTLAAMNLTAGQASGEQPLANILNLLMNQQLSAQQNNPASTPAQGHGGMPPASAAAAAAAALGQQQQHGHRASMYGRAPAHAHAFNFPHPRNAPSPSSCILGSGRLQTSPAPYHQSSLYAPSVPTMAQLQQAAQQAQAAYAAELESMRRRSLDSATQALYSRTLAAQQAQAAANQRRSLDTYATNYGRAIQRMWPSEAENTIAMAQFALQQQQLHVQQAQQQKQHEQEAEAEQLLRSAFTSASQELSEDEKSAGSLSVSLSSNLDTSMSMHSTDDMFGRMLSDLQQQQQQQYSS